MIEEYKIAVGTESALKIRAVETVMDKHNILTRIVPVKAESLVGDQPIGLSQMQTGARNRALHARRILDDGDCYIGIENGLVPQGGQWFDPTCIVIITSRGEEFVSFGAFFPIPDWMVSKVIGEETELGEVVRTLDGNTSQEKDPMNYFSEGTVLREELLSQAIQCAFVPLLHSSRWNS